MTGDLPRAPVVLAYGMGVDSTALLVELDALGTPPDLVLTADTGAENPLTYDYYAMISAWMDRRGIRHETVRYTPRRFKNWPPYYTILENVLTNATLPSISMGLHSCSLKWKIAHRCRRAARRASDDGVLARAVQRPLQTGCLNDETNHPRHEADAARVATAINNLREARDLLRMAAAPAAAKAVARAQKRRRRQASRRSPPAAAQTTKQLADSYP